MRRFVGRCRGCVRACVARDGLGMVRVNVNQYG